MTALTTFRDWLTAQRAPRAAMAGLFAASIALMIAAAFLDEVLHLPVLPAIVGCLAGVALFCSAYAACLLLLPATTLDRLDFKNRYPIATRRPATAAAAIVWLILLLLLGGGIPQVLGGTLNIAVLLALYSIWAPTPTEAEAQAAAHALAQAQAQAEAQPEAQAEADAHARAQESNE